MSVQSLPSKTPSQGGRVLVALVTGEIGSRIQAWRERHDPRQAKRIAPHATLSYWMPTVEYDLLARQVRHAFDRPVTVRLGGVRELGNRDGTFYVEVLDPAALDAARERLYDGTHVPLRGQPKYTWHVTCIRYSNGRDLDELRRLAAELRVDAEWPIETIAYLELSGERYHTLAEWQV